MSCNSEHLEPLLRELANVNITPDVARTAGGHIRIRWKANGINGPILRSIVTSYTPSDHRSTLNCRARIRAFLRQDGLLNRPKPAELPLAKALALPAPREPDGARFERLENDIVALLDIVGDLTAKLIAHGIKLGDDVAAPPLAYVQQPKTQKQTRGRPGENYWRHDFLLCIEYQVLPLSEITKRAGCTYGNASVRLNQLKKEGVVENIGRGMWRKKANGNGNGHHHEHHAP
jgi:hypothetical protein